MSARRERLRLIYDSGDDPHCRTADVVDASIDASARTADDGGSAQVEPKEVHTNSSPVASSRSFDEQASTPEVRSGNSARPTIPMAKSRRERVRPRASSRKPLAAEAPSPLQLNSGPSRSVRSPAPADVRAKKGDLPPDSETPKPLGADDRPASADGAERSSRLDLGAAAQERVAEERRTESERWAKAKREADEKREAELRRRVEEELTQRVAATLARETERRKQLERKLAAEAKRKAELERRMVAERKSAMQRPSSPAAASSKETAKAAAHAESATKTSPVEAKSKKPSSAVRRSTATPARSSQDSKTLSSQTARPGDSSHSTPAVESMDAFKPDKVVVDSESPSDQSAVGKKQRRIKLRVAKRRWRPHSWLKEFLRSEATRKRECFGWGTATYAHIVALIVLSGLFLVGPPREEPIFLEATFSDHDHEVPESVFVAMDVPAQTEEVIETPPDHVPEPEPQPEPAEEAPPPPAFEPTANAESPEPVEDPSPSESTSESTVPSETSSEKGDNPNSKATTEADRLAAEHAKVPTPPHSVTSGNFTCWTEPPFPLPGQPYRIIILVRLPAGLDKYSREDLTGVVVGSDGYRKIIRGEADDSLPISHHTARIEIPVVGSERGLKDTIMVQSKVLRERRIIELAYPRF